MVIYFSKEILIDNEMYTSNEILPNFLEYINFLRRSVLLSRNDSNFWARVIYLSYLKGQ